MWIAARPTANHPQWVWLVANVHSGRLRSILRDRTDAAEYIRSWAGHADLSRLHGAFK
ncbi:hypothetical protein GCM10022286_30030 [Gryllotalpicola daejeonensis]|uniref:Transposase n=1 Tax=Gryllotalpicola daejeonensis TaxID=993087 RepID=A0ABP7ZNJ4_9MICO